jgi:hypothetical protein
MFKPSEVLIKSELLDNHGGFTAITKPDKRHVKQYRAVTAYPESQYTPYKTVFSHWVEVKRVYDGDSLWRPGALLKPDCIGRLVAYRKSFYQNNKNVIQAFYKVSGYRFLVTLWYSVDGKRIA